MNVSIKDFYKSTGNLFKFTEELENFWIVVPP